jgi:hypothetical protein
MCDKIRLKSQDCPICRYNRGGVGKSIQSEYPDTYGEMFDEETNGISASEVPVSSGEKYYWICPTCGRRFIGRVADVTAGHSVVTAVIRRRSLKKSSITTVSSSILTVLWDMCSMGMNMMSSYLNSVC